MEPRQSTIRFFVSGDPVPQPRPRASTRGGFARVHNPTNRRLQAWRELVILAARQESISGNTLTGPLMLMLDFVFRRPLAHHKAGQRDRALRAGVPCYADKKMDLDNLDKAVMDCLTESGIWKDDSQVCQLFTSKTWGIKPGVHVTIKELDKEEEKE